ncbi:MAG: ABC transporter permease [Solirubrobacteraceae bacterium]
MSATAIGELARRRRLPARVRIPWRGITTAAIMVVLAIANFALQPSLFSLLQVGILMQTALPLVIVAAAQTLVVLVRGIDLSVGGMMVLANTATVVWVGGRGGAHQLLLFGILALAAAAGLLNGLLVAVGRYEPFVATLGTWTIFNGIALTILPSDGGTPPPSLVKFAFGSLAGVPNSLIALLALLILWRLLRGSRFGTRIYAVGADAERARLNGVSVARVKLCVYALAGLLAGLAGVLLAGVTSSGTPTAGDPYILASVAAVVIGGTSLLGGSGGVGLTMMAAIALTFISDIISAINLESWVSVAASSGLLLLVVVARSLIDAKMARRLA